MTAFLRVEKTLGSLFLGPPRIYEVALKTFGQSLDLLFSLLELSRGLIIWAHFISLALLYLNNLSPYLSVRYGRHAPSNFFIVNLKVKNIHDVTIFYNRLSRSFLL